MSKTILVVDDETDIRFLIREILEDEGYTVLEAAHSEAALAIIDKNPDVALAILDIWLENSDLDGMALLKQLKKRRADLQVLMVSGHGTVEMAVKAIQQGAYDFLEKPFGSERLLLQVKRALDAATLGAENKDLRRQTGTDLAWVGHSAAAQAVLKSVARLTGVDGRVLLVGEAGTGKSLLARLMAQGGPLKEIKPDAELLPDKGTVYIDGIERADADAQTALLRVLTLGKAAVRIIAGATPMLDGFVAGGQFSRDLYDRLAVNRIDLPPLRERPEDIADLCRSLQPELQLTDGALLSLKSYRWPANVRELRQVLDLGATRARARNAGMVDSCDLPLGTLATPTNEDGFAIPLNEDLRAARESFERAYLQAQMLRHDNNVSAVARAVGMDRAALHRKLKALEGEEDAA